eukprot:3361097-Pyramimonas_sp.AAC.1
MASVHSNVAHVVPVTHVALHSSIARVDHHGLPRRRVLRVLRVRAVHLLRPLRRAGLRRVLRAGPRGEAPRPSVRRVPQEPGLPVGDEVGDKPPAPSQCRLPGTTTPASTSATGISGGGKCRNITGLLGKHWSVSCPLTYRHRRTGKMK